MGKRLVVQRRGKGGIHKSPGHRHLGEIRYPALREPTTATVLDIVHDPGHDAPVVIARLEATGSNILMFATEGVHVGKKLLFGTPTLAAGNVLDLARIPDGMPVYNIEARPGDGGKFVRSAGTTCAIVGHERNRVILKLPSGAFKSFHPQCRATIGLVGGGGRGDKPFVKAGKKMHSVRSRAKLFPVVSGVAKNAVDHPHGGGQKQHEGKPTTVARGTPPGRKVGLIAAKRTGKR